MMSPQRPSSPLRRTIDGQAEELHRDIRGLTHIAIKVWRGKEKGRITTGIRQWRICAGLRANGTAGQAPD